MEDLKKRPRCRSQSQGDILDYHLLGDDILGLPDLKDRENE